MPKKSNGRAHSTSAAESYFVADSRFLLFFAETKNNRAISVLGKMLERGEIRVPIAVWHEFEDMYADEAAAIEQYVKFKIRRKLLYTAQAAQLADALGGNLHFEPYGNSDWDAVGVATAEGMPIVSVLPANSPCYRNAVCKIVGAIQVVEEN
ncbi:MULTISPECIES: hypothetical protein [Roseomonadaceae]|uniref:PIN domain-containing protein n=1 Tax=Falsiroseomonas oleicola TaxID=2801474 RepID=A0ABS6H857_9PROT|nr:hypothetical protein [Roseomonas oleicola]MBU8544891.1 hypothetical protein [Roseomonas oleicola]